MKSTTHTYTTYVSSSSSSTTLINLPCDRISSNRRHHVINNNNNKLFSTSSIRIRRRFQLHCESNSHPLQTKEKRIRKFSPCLEGTLSSTNATLDTHDWRAVPDIWRYTADKYGDRVALVDPYHDPPTNITYNQLEQEILDFAEGLRVAGIKPEEKVALFAENSCRWLIADQGAMATGAINVVRGSRSSNEELLQIYKHSESVGLIVDNPEFYNRISDTFCSKASIRFVILLWGDKSSLANNGTEDIPVFSYKEIVDLGQEARKVSLDSLDAKEYYVYETINPNDVATLVYTSGTTGNPKGVMLTHKNLLHQIRNFDDRVPAVPGDQFLSMLPPWHAYERAAEYFIFSRGVEHVYTTVKFLKEDLKKYQPHFLISVPLVYETLYNGIQKQISTSSAIRKLIALTLIKVSLAYMDAKRIYEGLYLSKSQKQPSYLSSMGDWLWARFIAAVLLPLHALAKILVYKKIHSAIGISKAGISGGGSLPFHVDRFFEAIGVKVQNGYGLTEASPVVAARLPDVNVLGSVGPPLRHTEFKIVNFETGEILPPGSRGIVKVRGPQVMKGYYKNPRATKLVLDEAGWLDTGDIGWITPQHSMGRSRHCGGMIVLEGRAKDTIVLLTGENIEPQELEDAALRSSLIHQIVVVGQDQRRLGAIVVPNKDEVLIEAKSRSIVESDASELSREKTTSLLREEIRKWTAECSFHIGPILVVDEPFTIDSGLMTPTMKIRRDKIVAKFKDQISSLYNWLDTGDIGWIAPQHSIGRSRHCGGLVVIEGHAKDTIVLLTGENVEPQELEDAALRSSLIHQIVDERRLGALVVPNKDEVLLEAKVRCIVNSDATELNKDKMTNLLHEEIGKWRNREMARKEI
ncbi:hypothetical protein ACFE04_004758 [Oxalis oulophora]